MGVPFHTQTICSLLEAEYFVDHNLDMTDIEIAVIGVDVQDIFDLVDLLGRKEEESGWVIQNLDCIRGDGRKLALFVEDCLSLVDDTIKFIDDGALTSESGKILKEEASKFLQLVKGNRIFTFFIGFAQFMVNVAENAIEAAADLDGGEESDGVDGEVDVDEGTTTDREEGGVDGEVDVYEGAPTDGEEGSDEGADVAIQVPAPRHVELREKLVQAKAALERLPGVRLIFPLVDQIPVYSELRDFAHTFPVDPEPEPLVPPALPADDIPAQPNVNGAGAE